MYSKIHQLKMEKLNKSQVARKLGLNIKTVIKYWNLDPSQFAEQTQRSFRRSQQLDPYETQILARLREFPDLSSAQIHDWLQEIYPECSVRERTVRRYVAQLRADYNLPKIILHRQYEAVDELPPGQQLQVDFGEITVPTTNGRKKKLYCMATVLSHSRFKYAEWSDQPFTTAKLTVMLRRSFEYMEGMTQELVFDQDKLVAVSENHGDILFTEEFERFKQDLKFKVYLCRKGDPESKGKIEAVIKYVKNNFAKHRLFTSLKDWNQAQIDWLKRTGNQKEHGTTKKVPAKVHAVKKQHLQPVPLIKLPEDIVTATVRKDNTILYQGNRYSLPLGTYEPGRNLRIVRQENLLQFFDHQTEVLIAEHSIALGRGLLIKAPHHRRDSTKAVTELQEKTLALLGNTTSAQQFLKALRKEKSRYAKDQFELLIEVANIYDPKIVERAITECLHLKFISAVSCRDMAQYLAQSSVSDQVPESPFNAEQLHLNHPVPVIQTEHRNVRAYTSLYGGMP